MFRERLNSNSKYALVSLVPPNAHLRVRTMPGSIPSLVEASGKPAGLWLRVLREGDRFTAYTSPDGKEWTVIGSQTVPMSRELYIGMATGAPNIGVALTCTFSTVVVTAPPRSR
jgi:regulation of enolase protein 1 (concanavalin A-like superfamily)